MKLDFVNIEDTDNRISSPIFALFGILYGLVSWEELIEFFV